MTETDAKLLTAVSNVIQSLTQQQALTRSIILHALSGPAREQAQLLLIKELEAAQLPLKDARLLLAELVTGSAAPHSDPGE